MKIILDENIPLPLSGWLSPHQVTTVQKEGLVGFANGDLIAKINGHFDVFITVDKNLRYQQNLSGRTIAILELPTNQLPLLTPLQQQLSPLLDRMKPSEYQILELNSQSRH